MSGRCSWLLAILGLKFIAWVDRAPTDEREDGFSRRSDNSDDENYNDYGGSRAAAGRTVSGPRRHTLEEFGMGVRRRVAPSSRRTRFLARRCGARRGSDHC